MSSIVVTNTTFVNLPTELTKGTLNSTTYTASGTVVTLSDAAYASLSPTCFTSGALLFGGTDVGAGYEVMEPAKTLPATATGAIFNVVGGRVLVTQLFGQVAVAIGATASTLSIGYLPTGGSQQNIGGTALAAIASDTVGTTYYISATPAVLKAATGFYVPEPIQQWVLNPGAINITTSGTNATGTVGWTVVYKPLDAGAAITAA